VYRDEDGLAQSIDLGSAIVKRGTLIAFACKDNAKSPGFQSYADGATEVNDSLAFHGSSGATCPGIGAAVRGVDHGHGNLAG
jgi:hypothetical protein